MSHRYNPVQVYCVVPRSQKCIPHGYNPFGVCCLGAPRALNVYHAGIIMPGYVVFGVLPGPQIYTRQE